jgi:hypothetical protein
MRSVELKITVAVIFKTSRILGSEDSLCLEVDLTRALLTLDQMKQVSWGLPQGTN